MGAFIKKNSLPIVSGATVKLKMPVKKGRGRFMKCRRLLGKIVCIIGDKLFVQEIMKGGNGGMYYICRPSHVIEVIYYPE